VVASEEFPSEVLPVPANAVCHRKDGGTIIYFRQKKESAKGPTRVLPECAHLTQQ